MTSNEANGRGLAAEFRLKHRLGKRPLGDLFELVHKSVGIDVLSLPAEEAEHGLLMRHPRTERFVIAVATTPHPLRQRSSIAHELGHFLAGDLDNAVDPEPGRRTNREITADAFARHLLLPIDVLTGGPRAGSPTVTLSDLSDVVREFGVSPEMATIQMRDAQLISQQTQRVWKTLTGRGLATDFGWLGYYDALAGASQEPRSPQSLMRRSVLAYKQGLLGVNELAAWYGAPAAQLLADLGEPTPSVFPRDDWDSDAPLFGESS